MKTYKDYYHDHMVVYEPSSGVRGGLDIKVLPELTGKPWNENALHLVHALRPSSIRVTTGEIKCDSRTWRVTVYINEENIIQEIEQEVEVTGMSGAKLREALRQ